MWVQWNHSRTPGLQWILFLAVAVLSSKQKSRVSVTRLTLCVANIRLLYLALLDRALLGIPKTWLDFDGGVPNIRFGKPRRTYRFWCQPLNNLVHSVSTGHHKTLSAVLISYFPSISLKSSQLEEVCDRSSGLLSPFCGTLLGQVKCIAQISVM